MSIQIQPFVSADFSGLDIFGSDREYEKTRVFNIRGLPLMSMKVTVNYPVKPTYMPRTTEGQASGRLNVLRNAYGPDEPMTLQGHVDTDDILDIKAAQLRLEETLCDRFLKDEELRKCLGSGRSVPKTLDDYKTAISTTSVLSKIDAPRGSPPDASCQGVRCDLIGYGAAVETAKVATSAQRGSKYISSAEFVPLGDDVTPQSELWLQIGDKGFTNTVPWLTNGRLSGKSPVLLSGSPGAPGAPKRRIIGPQDILKGSSGELILEITSLTYNVGTGCFYMSLTAKRFMFKLPAVIKQRREIVRLPPPPMVTDREAEEYLASLAPEDDEKVTVESAAGSKRRRDEGTTTDAPSLFTAVSTFAVEASESDGAEGTGAMVRE